jgi:hypothetical protein
MNRLLYWIDRIFGHRWVRREELDTDKILTFNQQFHRNFKTYRCAWCGAVIVKDEE